MTYNSEINRAIKEMNREKILDQMQKIFIDELQNAITEELDKEIITEIRDPSLIKERVEPHPDVDFMTINLYKAKKKQSYHYVLVRGYGPTYSGFYKWLNKKDIIQDIIDWPWDSFYLKDADVLELRSNYQQYILTDE